MLIAQVNLNPAALRPPPHRTLYFLFIQLFIRWFMGPLPLPSSGNTELRWFPPRADKRLNYSVSFLHLLAYVGRVFGAVRIQTRIDISISSLRPLLPGPTSAVYPVHKWVHHKRPCIRCIFYVCALLIAFSLHLATVRLIDSMFVFLTLIRWTFILSRQYVGCSICLYNLVATQECFFAKKYTNYE